jgi:hypothetical protein
MKNDGRRIEKLQCCICAREFTGMGNNPEPFHGDRCCEECDDRFVTPCRMLLADGGKLNEKLEVFLKALAKYGNFVRDAKKTIAVKRLQVIAGDRK